MTDLADLLNEITSASPCGEDLTYDPEFMALESTARSKTEQQFGDTVIPAEPPDWRAVERAAATLFRRTKDVRVAVLLSRAWTNARGPAGLAQGVQLVAELLDRYWDSLHPLPEDGSDYYMRMNAVAMLGDVTGLVRELRDTEFLRTTFGSISVRDAEALARGHATESSTSVTLDQLRAGVAEACARGTEAMRGVTVAQEAMARIQTLCESKLPSYQVPELGNLQGVLRTLHELLPRPEASPVPQADSETAQTPVPADAAPPNGSVRQLRNRQDAVEQLLRIAEFLEQTEPTNPAPLLIHRAAKLMRMNFIDILRELAPESVGQVEIATGSRAQN